MKSSPRELIVVAALEARLRVTPEGLISEKGGKPLQELNDILLREHAELQPLYGVSEDFLEDRMSERKELFSVPALRLSLYYRAIAPDERLEYLAEQFRGSELIDSAYIKPGAEPATFDAATLEPPELISQRAGAQLACDFTDDQEYLLPGEFGIDVPAAWKMVGGKGEGISIIDIEGAWCFTHSDLIDNSIGLVGGVEIRDQNWRDHGTAVLGLLCGVVNDFGISGISPKARVNAASIFGFPNPGIAPTWGTSAAIRHAADTLVAGDVLVLEVHFPGPEAGFKPGSGYIPAEWWPDCQAAINYAIGLNNIVVVSAAGNGSVDLDGAVYNENPPTDPFPTGWQNPFRRDRIDTGSIFVGAGAPPNGLHHRNWGPGRSRLALSNYGSAVDAQAWGKEVTTTGFKPLCGVKEEFHYTTLFGGTSSAAAIVAGAVTCLQGIRKAANQAMLSSREVRRILQETGSPQTDFPGIPPDIPARPRTERIGNLPNLKQMIEKMPQ